ncbi:MAG: hypothetical protein K0R10_137 [Alphaproteobacteria bacterium]|jgi:hypothetical protein|nr:hypothetical protein [Alphaproteobacteria bacterium]
MKRINQFSVYTIGKNFGELAKYADRKDPVPRNIDLLFHLMDARQGLYTLLEGELIQLQVSVAPAERFLKSIEYVLGKYYKDWQKEMNFEGEIPSWELSTVSNNLRSFEIVFTEEMNQTATYYVPRRGIYHTPALVDYAHEIFTPDIIDMVPPKSKDDWKAAGRCFAFGLYTASGFHVGRAVEGMMEVYYQFFSGKAGATLKGWDNYYTQLEKIRNAGTGKIPTEKILLEFKQMKDDYRNPISHPRQVLDECDSGILFNNGTALISMMASELKKLQESQQALPAVDPVSRGALIQALTKKNDIAG